MMRLFRLFKYAKYIENCLLLFNDNFSINAKSITLKQNYNIYSTFWFFIFSYIMPIIRFIECKILLNDYVSLSFSLFKIQ